MAARILGDDKIDSVVLGYQVDSIMWVNLTMNKCDEAYVATIPAQPFNTVVNYKIYAFDKTDGSDVSKLYSYTIKDLVPPVITHVNHLTDTPNPIEPVSIVANVTEPKEASGIQNVTLWYSTSNNWKSVKMALNGNWMATIPEHDGGTYVQFFIESYDKAGNKALTSNFSYTPSIPKRSPEPVLLYAPLIIHTGEEVHFDASSSYDLDGSVVSYSWDFGDGSISSEKIVSHLYNENGEYVIKLTVTDNESLAGTKIGRLIVKNRSPVAQILETKIILDKEEIVTFDGNPSYDLDGTIVSYIWDFGDGTTATGQSVKHSFTETRVYRITLTVTDNDGATDSATITRTVINKSPVAAIAQSSETVVMGNPIIFDASKSYDPDGNIVSYSWDFGDGITATGINVSHIFEKTNEYTVTLTITDNEGATDQAKVRSAFVNTPPVAIFVDSVENPFINQLISFDASDSYDLDGFVISYDWDFGDGSLGTGLLVNHVYSDYGTYRVTLTVTDHKGATSNASVFKTISNQAPIASFIESAETILTGESILFDASESHDPDGSIVSYEWDFGDGIIVIGILVDHIYVEDGNYNITLTVTDDYGKSDLISETKIVLNQQPIASITRSATTVIQNNKTVFDASNSYDLDGTIVNYEWDFGDGTTGKGVIGDHEYNEKGDYNLTLTVIDNDGDSTSESITITVEAESTIQLAIISVIGLGLATLTATLLYGLFVNRKKKKET